MSDVSSGRTWSVNQTVVSTLGLPTIFGKEIRSPVSADFLSMVESPALHPPEAFCPCEGASWQALSRRIRIESCRPRYPQFQPVGHAHDITVAKQLVSHIVGQLECAYRIGPVLWNGPTRRALLHRDLWTVENETCQGLGFFMSSNAAKTAVGIGDCRWGGRGQKTSQTTQARTPPV